MADKKPPVINEEDFKTFKPCLVCTRFDGVGKEAVKVTVGRGADQMDLTLSRTECKRQCWMLMRSEKANPNALIGRTIADETTCLEVRLPHKVATAAPAKSGR